MPHIDTSHETIYALDEPKQYKVILHNDDYTPMEFVVQILMEIFHKSATQSQQIMLQVHKQGKAICGIYIHEIAATKVSQVTKVAKANNFPLLATLEEA